MKKQFYFMAIIYIAIATTVISCQKETIILPPDTSLEITVTDDFGNIVRGATVELYATENDFYDATNVIETGLTDANGRITFGNLSSAKYYWYVSKDCKNNMNGGFGVTSAIPNNKVSIISTVISSTGTLKFVNTSNNPYEVYVNGTLAISNLQGGYNQSLTFEPTGSYSFRVVQISGYNYNPADITYSGTLTCGETLTTTFP